jgi:hypothetical protein
MNDAPDGSETISQDIRGPGRIEMEDVAPVLSQEGGEVDGGPSQARGSMDNSEEEEEEKYGLFRNEAAKSIWHYIKDVMFGKPETGKVDVLEDCETSILLLARVDAWIMTNIECTRCEGGRGGGRQRKFLENFERMLPIAVYQLTRELYKYVEEWEASDLENPEVETGPVGIEEDVLEERKRVVFCKTYNACVAIEVPTVNKTYLALKADWFKKYVGEELGIVHDCYIAQFDKDYTELNHVNLTDRYGGLILP